MKNSLFRLKENWSRLTVNDKTTTILKTVMFKLSYTLGSERSLEFHEALAFSVLKKGSNEVFRSESINAVVEYKWGKLLPLFWL